MLAPDGDGAIERTLPDGTGEDWVHDANEAIGEVLVQVLAARPR